MAEIMKEYSVMYGVAYEDVDLYNQNINNRLARKSAQYQRDGGWLDLVIVVDRLLTGFDAPTIQALYVDKELKWHGLLQAFSRTNRVMAGKDRGMIVTFRKPKTMASNVRDAIKLFSNEERDWEKLVPREYNQVRKDFESAHKTYQKAKKELKQAPYDLKKRLTAIKTFQAMKKFGEAIKSYEEFEKDFPELSDIVDVIDTDFGHIENEKAAVKEILSGQGAGEEEINEAFQIEFSADQNAMQTDKIDSYYISQLLKDINNESNRQKFDTIIGSKPDIVKIAYTDALKGLSVAEPEVLYNVNRHFKRTIEGIISETAFLLDVPIEELQTSFNEYNKDKNEAPYLNTIIEKSALTKETFEQNFPNEEFRRRTIVIEDYWEKIIKEKLLPLKTEIAAHR